MDDDKIITAPLSRVLKGTTRGAVLEIAKELGYVVEERCPLWSELASQHAREAFVTGSIKMVIPVVKVGGITLGTGHPGPVTRKLSQTYRENISRWLE